MPLKNLPDRTTRSFQRVTASIACFAFSLSLFPAGISFAQTPASGSAVKPVQATARPGIPPALQATLDRLDADLRKAQAAGDRAAESAALKDMGYIYLDDLRQTNQALETFNRGLTIAEAAGDRHDEALILLGVAVVDYRKNKYPEGLDIAQKQLAAGGALGDREVEARAWIVMGFAYDHNNQLPLAVDASSQAFSATQAISNPESRLRSLLKLGDLLRVLAEDGSIELDRMRSVSTQARLLAQQARDGSAEAHAVYSLAKVDALSGHPQDALKGYTQALAMLSAQDDAYGMRGVLLDRSVTYRQMNDLSKALDDVKQRIALLVRTGDRKGSLQSMIFASDLLADLGRFEEALDDAHKGLKGAREDHLRDVEAYALTVIGGLYLALGQGQRALEFNDEALAILREIGPKNKEADALRVNGFIERDLLHDSLKAAAAFLQALQIYTAQRDRLYQSETLISLCNTYGKPNGTSQPLDGQKALGYCAQALATAQETGDANAEKEALLTAGEVNAALGKSDPALALYNRAFPLVLAGKKPQEQSDLFFDLMETYKQSQPTLAIFFGKQSIGLLQQVRGTMQKLDDELQSSFVMSYENRYRNLADILIAQGRLPEAQQVLDLLKRREFVEYTRGEAPKADASLDLTPAEEQAAVEYERASRMLVAESEEYSRLRKLGTRTAVEQAEYERLSADLSSGSKGLNGFYDRLYTVFGKNTQANKQLADVKGTAALLKQQVAHTPHTVALYTLVNPNRLSVLVITGSTMVARETAISEADLNAKVLEFRRALQDPARDPRPMAQEVYKILVGPVQADLDQAGTQTIIWSLDGVLRYIPMAALYDGQHYLIERYSSVNFTPAAGIYLADQPVMSNMSAVAMGVSKQFDKDLTALPAVATELRQIVHEPQSPAGGALPGAILLDAAFTEKGMEEKLNGQRKIVHIASHFVSRPGDDRRSYLLLAGKDELSSEGYHLTVADFRDNERISLENTDLLTLSACDTGLSRATSDGREVDGLAATAQIKGAKAVLSSLWKVNDASTGQFMADFYNRWADGDGKLPKVIAIREAQLDLLLNRKPPQSTSGAASSDLGNFTHPYFWAPFVLVGNWR